MRGIWGVKNTPTCQQAPVLMCQNKTAKSRFGQIGGPIARRSGPTLPPKACKIIQNHAHDGQQVALVARFVSTGSRFCNNVLLRFQISSFDSFRFDVRICILFRLLRFVRWLSPHPSRKPPFQHDVHRFVIVDDIRPLQPPCKSGQSALFRFDSFLYSLPRPAA